MEFTRKELYDLVWSEPITTLCKRFGLSDNGLRKHCKAMNVPTPPSGYWAKLKAGYKTVIPILPVKDQDKKQHTVLNEVEPDDEKKVDILTPLNRFKARELEIAKGDTSSFIVPEVLYAIDPLIVDTKEKHRKEHENIHLKRNPYKSEIKSTLNLHVSEKSMDRALSIYGTIIKALKSRRHNIKIKDNQTYAFVNEEEIQINITERRKQDPNNVDRWGSKISSFCGELSFNIDYNYWHKSTFHDTKFTKLEDKIITIIANLEVHSEQIKEERIESERKEKIRQEEERIRKEFEKKQEDELKEFKSLFKMAERLHKTNILRQYISTYEQFIMENGEMNEEIFERLKWAKDKADWIDPFISKHDKYLDKYNKDEIIQPNNEKNDPWRNEDYSSHNYSFWSNPFRHKKFR